MRSKLNSITQIKPSLKDIPRAMVKQFNEIRKKAFLRFYEELNDFLPPDKQKKPFAYLFFGSPSIKDVIEALGIPHGEVDMILINGKSESFDYSLKSGDNVSVYPMFESMDISSTTKVRAKPLRENKFILDVHLGKTAKNLRMLGFDAHYENNLDDPEIIEIAQKDKRIILTRDKELLKNSKVTHGYWVRSKNSDKQISEVIKRFDLYSKIKPFHRCMSCNGLIEEIEKEKVLDRLEPKTKQYFNEFFICLGCDKIYWKGSHFERMEAKIAKLLKAKPN
ncbi:MAG: Mut7-C ubiquitin/RNAse domain-containing protein [Proteobacteria bacterium]|nr:Mut7-C ubiquitin/RNAse domain-containing protein [Pseudomonadota bacterium]